MTTWYGLWAPAGTPSAIAKLLAQHVNQALRSAEVQDRFKDLGLEAASDTPDAFAAFQRAEQKRWSEVLRRAGVRPE